MSSSKKFSILIPNMSTEYDKKYVAERLRFIGNISEIHFVNRINKKGKQYINAFVHFAYVNEDDINVIELINAMDDQAYTVYLDDPYWALLKSNSTYVEKKRDEIAPVPLPCSRRLNKHNKNKLYANTSNTPCYKYIDEQI